MFGAGKKGCFRNAVAIGIHPRLQIQSQEEKMLTPNPAYVQELIERVNHSPFPRHMAMRLVSMEIDTATLQLETAQCHLQPFGIVHGGVLATLIDTATFWSAFLRIPEKAGLVNIDLKLNYLKPVKDGLIIASGLCIRSGRSISYAESRVVDAAGQILAHGTSTLMALPDKGIPLNARKFLDE
jgi:uncharacterized protein (TIGR00369 family)